MTRTCVNQLRALACVSGDGRGYLVFRNLPLPARDFGYSACEHVIVTRPRKCPPKYAYEKTTHARAYGHTHSHGRTHGSPHNVLQSMRYSWSVMCLETEGPITRLGLLSGRGVALVC